MTTPPRMIRVDLPYDVHDLENCSTIGDVRSLLNEIEEAVPTEFRANIKWDCRGGYEDCAAYLAVFYERPETDLDRQNKERAKREREAARHHEEYQQYLRLKVKYEGSK